MPGNVSVAVLRLDIWLSVSVISREIGEVIGDTENEGFETWSLLTNVLFETSGLAGVARCHFGNSVP